MNTIYFNTLIFTASFLISHSIQAAEYIKLSKKNATIKIESSQILKRQGQDEYVSMTLLAKDKKALHKGQVYTVKSLKASEKTIIDSSYDEPNGVIFIDYLIQADTLRHQATLQLIKNKPMEFVVVEKTTFALQHNYHPPSQQKKDYYKSVSQPSLLRTFPPQLNSSPY